MRGDDEQHYKELAEQHHVHIMTEGEAQFHNFMAALTTGNIGLLYNAASFSGTIGDQRHCFVDEDETDNDDVIYFTMLHEMGHIALGHTEREQAKLTFDQKVDQEVEAWEWAWYNSRRDLSDEAICNMIDSLSTYTDQLVKIQRGEAKPCPGCGGYH